MTKQRRFRPRRRRGYRVVLFWLSCLLILCLGIVLWNVANQAKVPTLVAGSSLEKATPSPFGTMLVAGMPAPDFDLATARGNTYHLYEHRGHIIVLSFLATQSAAQATPSRSQAVSLLSMQQQYGPKSAEVVLIDESALVERQSPTMADLLNISYDWHLGSVPLLADTLDHATARAYSLQQIPTTFLIDATGSIIQRWNGQVLSSQLGPVLQHLAGSSSA